MGGGSHLWHVRCQPVRPSVCLLLFPSSGQPLVVSLCGCVPRGTREQGTGSSRPLPTPGSWPTSLMSLVTLLSLSQGSKLCCT